MNYEELYREKLTTPDNAVSIIENGDTVLVPMAIGQPITLINALAKRSKELDATFFNALDMVNTDMATVDADDKLKIDNGYAGKFFRPRVQAGDFTFTPKRLYDTKCWGENRPLEAVMFVASPMDQHGFFSMGTNLDYTWAAIREAKAKKIIIEVNQHMPRTWGMGFIHVSEVNAIVENHKPLLAVPIVEPDEKSKIMGQYIAEMIPDGATIQLGLGSIPEAVAQFMENKKDLGVHTELFSDSLRILWEKGVITNRRKNFMPYICVASFAFGSQKLYDFINYNPVVHFFSTGFTNDPYVIGQNDNMISVNSALSVDITGQVNAESFGPVQYGGIGGNLDFVEGAWRSKGGKSFIAMEATAKNDTISRIVPQFPAGQFISTGRSDVHYIVTEYGVALIKGYSIRERAKRLINIAHPNFRDELTFTCKKMNII